MLIIGIEVEQGVRLVVLGVVVETRTVLFVSRIHHSRQLRHKFAVFAFKHIVAQVEVQLQVFETVHLIVEGNVADRTIELVVQIL